MGHRRVREGGGSDAGYPLFRLTVHAEDHLGRGVVGGQIAVAERPRRRDAVRRRHLFEVIWPEAWQRSAEDLGVATDRICHARPVPAPVRVLPSIVSLVAAVGEDRLGTPVLGF